MHAARRRRLGGSGARGAGEGGAFAPPPRPAASEHIAGVKTTMRAARLRRAARSAMLGP
ncbi:hypothetical protein D512_12083 [Burkholderia pseudomallei MSHR1043]|nr:hypothetical protein BUC_1653 [Burkholderia pseudomallei 576]EEH23889.1 hypothetical protein BUH_2407 [Burkholderia pseudomallei Pakistan 9]EMP77644.1 hypothetical protein D512_12083 [Burkholderia pseudomallei MSHR1043]KGD41887.1 hypothetical protein DP44_4643 [Burkholderia pseudomallei]